MSDDETTISREVEVRPGELVSHWDRHVGMWTADVELVGLGTLKLPLADAVNVGVFEGFIEKRGDAYYSLPANTALSRRYVRLTIERIEP